MISFLLYQFGSITAPEPVAKFGSLEKGALGNFLNLILNLMVVAGGIYALFNLVLAGYSFLSAGDDPQKIQGAWSKIWQTLIGLVFIAGSFLLAAIFGKLIFGEFSAIISPVIKTIEDL